MTDQDEDALPISKTRRKKAMEELQSLGEELVALPTDRVKKIALPDDLRDAVLTAQRMPRHDEARRRQLQFIGRLMRGSDAEPIRAAIAEARGESAEQTARLHLLEKLRDDILADEKALHQIASQYPSADLQHLRALRRSALKEQEQNKPPKSFRALFQYLKTLGNTPADDEQFVDSPAEDEQS
ncbi:ribosome biogenesis factor YjgA [Propionivibrio dicarboxylicus]|uniref:Dual-action ribosomal maturation protein DarP n=1 Tax=Propionivibrio dicarboxylicus TaxID=83767 RepID=A0A1G8IFI4_9RHOO|nr:ribosome biogenesis factor YjgA [Propionivibrio dicarboxylicus]SDI17779.1 ribosome-associated protein [Propionivibrio dicarboxylicus]